MTLFWSEKNCSRHKMCLGQNVNIDLDHCTQNKIIPKMEPNLLRSISGVQVGKLRLGLLIFKTNWLNQILEFY